MATDRTAGILQSYHDPRIKLINNEKNIGLTKSLNKGLRIAKGEYVARMDADDVSYPNRLKEEISVIIKDDNIGMVTSWFDIINQRTPMNDFYLRVRNTNFPEEIFY
ncbi:glycosyltransferase family 2 protein, partial [candidate division WOR-3 bacterium]|nr:glycosyltransferase family 2 protein [candidate division WOR-3 bacterium]